jgi:phage terminase large subunit GpA-like protein
MGAPGLPFDPVMLSGVAASLQKGLAAFAVPDPVSLPVWAERNFYLSAESSYVEQEWRPWSFQPAVLACMGHDDIEEVNVQKSARVGYTKMLMAATGYFIQHKRRNIAIWQPTDEDRDEFVKSELEPMLRDVKCMADIYNDAAKNKNNTLKQKSLGGCMLYTKGGKAAKNYRRISVDVGILDEASGFDLNIENEGDAFDLAKKRTEGASFPKMIAGSTPKLRGLCQIEARVRVAQHVFRRHVPCPHCDEMHPLTWGSPKTSGGMKWERAGTLDETAATVRQACPHCGALYTQAEFITIEARGEWRTDSGVRLTVCAEGLPHFTDAGGQPMPVPRHVAFTGLWSAYSPNVSWPGILREYLEAIEKAKGGDKSKLQTFTNTTLGETWYEEGEKTEASELERRAEAYPLRVVPLGGLVLVAGVDTQDDRWEITLYAIGRGEEMWVIDYAVLYGNPGNEADWDKLDAYLASHFRHASGQQLGIEAAAIDTGGHFTHQVYNFCRTRERRRIFAVRGANRPGLPIKGRASMQDVNWRGRILKHGVKLWDVGTDTAKDLIHGRLKVTQPGAGYVHFSKDLPPPFYTGLTIEQRVLQKTATGAVYRWINPSHGRNEPLDCTVYALFAAQALDLHRYTNSMWAKLEAAVQPLNGDLFAAPEAAEPDAQPARPVLPSALVAGPRQRRPSNRRQAAAR